MSKTFGSSLSATANNLRFNSFFVFFQLLLYCALIYQFPCSSYCLCAQLGDPLQSRTSYHAAQSTSLVACRLSVLLILGTPLNQQLNHSSLVNCCCYLSNSRVSLYGEVTAHREWGCKGSLSIASSIEQTLMTDTESSTDPPATYRPHPPTERQGDPPAMH